jgi:hypothetical protein
MIFLKLRFFFFLKIFYETFLDFDSNSQLLQHAAGLKTRDSLANLCEKSMPRSTFSIYHFLKYLAAHCHTAARWFIKMMKK